MALTRYKLRELDVLETLDTLTNVIKRVVWDIEFYETNTPEVSAASRVETVLDTSSIDPNTFVPISGLTQAQILEWAKAQQGGDAFIDNVLRPAAEEHLAYLNTFAGTIPYSITDIPEA